MLTVDQIRQGFVALLSNIPATSLFEMSWAIRALGSGDDVGARAVFGNLVPEEAIGAQLGSPYAVHPWEIETLCNERLAFNDSVPVEGVSFKYFYSAWGSIAQLANILRNLEDREYGALRAAEDIWREMERIAGRQFEWQRGYHNLPQLYRAAYLYGGDACKEHLSSKFGTSLNEMSLIGYALFAAFARSPRVNRVLDTTLIGADQSALERVLSRIALPLSDLSNEARKAREDWPTTAYRPSVFRRTPCILGGRKNPEIWAPLPDLIIERTSSGLFYELVSGGSAVRDEYSRRFEGYCFDYISRQLPSLNLTREWRYSIGKNPYDSPDLIVLEKDSVTLAVECKATRMSAQMRLGDSLADDRGLNEIAKGVFQLWRFFAHCRLGHSRRGADDDATGLLVTLDSWLVMGNESIGKVLAIAGDLADKDPLILEEDRRPVAFCQITDLENTLAEADEPSFIAAARANASTHVGWLLSSTLTKVTDPAPSATRKPYPFDNLRDLLPWWGALEDTRKRRKTK